MKEAVPSQALFRVAECLYRNGHGVYYALVKVQGKQIKKSLRTSDISLAKRRLSDFRQKAERLIGTEKGILFEELCQRWLSSIKPHFKNIFIYQKRFERKTVYSIV